MVARNWLSVYVLELQMENADDQNLLNTRLETVVKLKGLVFSCRHWVYDELCNLCHLYPLSIQV